MCGNKESFYERICQEVYEDKALENLVCGQERENSGFYELCCRFAEVALAETPYSESIVKDLRSRVDAFCSRNRYPFNHALFKAILQGYSVLLPKRDENGREPGIRNEDFKPGDGRYVFEFLYPSGVGPEIMQGVFGEVMY